MRSPHSTPTGGILLRRGTAIALAVRRNRAPQTTGAHAQPHAHSGATSATTPTATLPAALALPALPARAAPSAAAAAPGQCRRPQRPLAQ